MVPGFGIGCWRVFWGLHVFSSSVVGELLGDLAEVLQAHVMGRDTVDAGSRTALPHQLAEAVRQVVSVGDLAQGDLPAGLLAELLPPPFTPLAGSCTPQS